MPTKDSVSERAEQALIVAAVAGLIVVGVIFFPGLEIFRTAKEAAMRAQAIIGAFAVCTAVAYGGLRRVREMMRQRAVVALLAAAVTWTAITTLTSGQRWLSEESLVTVVCSALLFISVWYVAPRVPPSALLVLAITAAVNAALAATQEYAVWNPFQFDVAYEVHLRATALMGNPNDVGAYLALCAVILVMTMQTLHGWQRWIAAAGGAAALTGVFISQTRTAVLAVMVTAFVMALRRSWKAGAAIVAIALLALLAATQVDIPGLSRIATAPKYLQSGQWNAYFSQRLPAFATAWAMFVDHPLLGVGPGAFKFFYLPYRIELSQVYPERIMNGAGVNFAETHNDHLQLLAETGLPGYALFLAACGVLAMHSLRSRETGSEAQRLAAGLALPFVVVLIVLALALFPLQIAATRHLLMTVSALIVGWSRM